MKGRHGAAHFAAFPRPPNYPNRNPNEHTYTKEKKLKRILASVFLVLAVIAAVGIFGVQTSDRTEAVLQDAGNEFEQAIPAAHGQAQVSIAATVPPDRTLPAGRTHTIDLKKFTVPGDNQTATTTYTLGDFAGNPNNVIFIIDGQEVVTPAANDMVIPNGILGVKAATTAGSTVINWRAHSSHAPGDASFPTADANFDVLDSFNFTSIAAVLEDPELPAPADRPLSAGAASNALVPTTTGTAVTWDIEDFPPAQYSLVATADPTGIVQLSVSAGELTITPVKRGTTTISTSVVHTLGTGTTPDAAAALDKWDLPDQTFTVTYSEAAPPINIIANTSNAPTMFDKEGTDAEGDAIVYTIRSDHDGVVGKFRTVSRSSATYLNRNVIFGLTDSGNQNLFELETGDPYRANTGQGSANPSGSVTAVEATLRVASGATLTPGQDYTFTVIANDQIGEDGEVQAGGADSVEVTVKVVQGNRAPVLDTLPNLTIPENTSTTAVLLDLNGRATDADRNTLSYSIAPKEDSDGEDHYNNFFNFPTAAGADGRFQLTLKKQVNYEDTDYDDEDEDPAATAAAKDAVRWTLVVTVTDGSLEDSQEITVTVTDEDEATPTTGLTFSVDENSAAGAEVGTVRIPNAAGVELTTAYSLDTNANGGGRFAISTSGALTIADPLPEGATLDYEAQSSWLLVAYSGEGANRQTRPVTVNINDVNEMPMFTRGAPVAPATTQTPLDDDIATDVYRAKVSESADVGDAVAYGWSSDDRIEDTTTFARGVIDDDTKDDTPPGVAGKLTYRLIAAQTTTGNPITSPEVAFSGPFAINASTGAITVSGRLDAETTASYPLFVKVTDNDATNAMSDTVKLTITVDDTNEPPYFVTGANSTTELTEVDAIEIDENTASGTVVARYYAVDPDGDDLTFVLRGTDALDFAINGETGVLTVAPGKTLDYETKSSYLLEIEVQDNAAGQGQIEQTINLNNLNDNSPVWQTPHTTHAREAISVNENVLRGTDLATYTATDADGDTITYTVGGSNGSQYQIGSANGMLKTLASLDADTNTSDAITVTASDGTNSITRNVRITIGDVNDSIGSITVKMANPVLGTNGDPNSALADRKTTVSIAVPEAPADLPATTGDSPVNFVETGAAGWGTTLRIEVLAESPGATCGNGNQCVVIELEGDDSDDILNVMAYRNSGKDNLFVAAVMPVQSANMATAGTAPVYRHADGSVPRIRVDEEDTLRIKFGNLRDSVTIDNEAPEFSNFLPEHEASTDDDEVQYTFTVTDAISGIPDPEDLPDVDGDDSYMAVAALVNTRQCHNVAQGVTPPSGTSMVANTNLHEGAQIYCPAATTPEVRVIVDDKDLDSVTDGFEVDTEVVLSANQISFVTFIACDAAGNCVAFDPDENDTREALAEITVDTIAPDLSQARTGVMWDAADNKYDDSRSFIQAIFTDLSKLNPDTIEADDFVVDGYTIKRVYWYDDPDAEDENWGTRYDTGSGSRAYREISKTVFIELEEELLPDATPDVSVVPNGLEDEAGKEQDDDEVEADDWIAPKFAVQSITSPLETSRDNVLVGEDQKVVLTVTSDERISTTKPLVDVDYVNAPAGCVDRSGIILRAGRDTDGDGRLEPGESRADCAVNAKGTPLNSVISKDGTNEWTITVDKPSATGYYNVYIYADDRSSQKNRGSEGVNPTDLVTKFFEKDGDVNADDAVFFEGDVQLPKPRVVVSGRHAGDTEPTVEFKRPLFIEVDFTRPFSADCSAGDKLSNKLECTAESSAGADERDSQAEYAQDSFRAVTITRFELDGVDMTDDVKTTDDETFLIALDDVGIGDHELKIQATDVAGNELKDVLEIEFEVEERDPFTRRLNPGWNLVSLPGSPADSAIASVFGSDIEVRTVYTYNPVTPGGWQVAVRETLDDAWQGDLTDITAKSGYWVLSDAIQDLEVSIPRLAGGAVGASTPIQPPVIPIYAGWNLIPVVDVTGDALNTRHFISTRTYLDSLDDGLDLARVLGFNTITNEWMDVPVTGYLQIGSAYWVFVRESASLVPGGIPLELRR